MKMTRTALDYDATAIYAGQPRYSMRVRNNDFDKIENMATSACCRWISRAPTAAS